MNRVVFSSTTDEWETPAALYAALDAEFGFRDDPCPLSGETNGLMREWQSPSFVNPPYSAIAVWMDKAAIEVAAGKTVVMLVPSRTDTRWWHKYAMQAREIRFLRGRLKFGNAKHGAPFPSVVLIFGNAVTLT
jgi:site-specific DNA-methyltransferase (adenine-specific)